MPDDLYHPPVMHLYFDDFIADTTDLSNEELGAYVRLMHRQWNTAAIPADPARAGNVAHGTPRQRMKAILAAIGDRLQPHPTLSGHVQTQRMEEVRESQRAHAAMQSARAKKGAEARNTRRNLSNAQVALKQSISATQAERERVLEDQPEASIPISDLRDPSPSARENAPAREVEPEQSLTQQSDALSDYLLDAAIGHGMQLEHRKIDPGKWRYENREAALRLVKCYGLESCRGRAMLYLAAVKTGKITSRIISVAVLEKCWNYRELDVTASASLDSEDEFLTELRADERRTRGAA